MDKRIGRFEITDFIYLIIAILVLYQRYGLTFKLTDHVFTGINIKAHSQDADFMDFRIGVYF